MEGRRRPDTKAFTGLFQGFLSLSLLDNQINTSTCVAKGIRVEVAQSSNYAPCTDIIHVINVLKNILQLIINSLVESPNSDPHQISPCNINAYLIPQIMRIEDMITQDKFS